MHLIKVIFTVSGLIITCLLAVFTAFTFNTLYQLEGIQALETYKPPTPTQILDINNEVIAEFYHERREIIDFNRISPKLIKATLSIEDKRFFSHYGVDFVRILKAFWVNFKSLSKKQGGSTITIQLSKLIFLHHRKTYMRKLIEVWYALQIEKQYTKEEILKFYFNQVNYGHGSYGVGAAASFFFSKKVSDLTVAESALLAGIPKSPTYYSPIRYHDKATERHQSVLSAMVKNGYLSQEEASREYQNFWTHFTSKNRNQQLTFADLSLNQAPYFTEYIRKKLKKDFPDDELYEKGIKVYTTLNLKHQKIAQEILWSKLQQQNLYKKRLNQVVPQKINLKLLETLTLYADLFDFPQLKLRQNIIRQRLAREMKKIQGMIKSTGILFDHPHLTHLGYDSFEVNNPSFSFQQKAQGALISIVPQTGYITAMVGGSRFNYLNQFNRAINLERQIGSILKPFIYALAIDQNLVRANTIVNDVPTRFENYTPKNYSGKYLGKITVREALKKSVNVLAVDTLAKVGLSHARRQLAQIFRAYTESSRDKKFPNDLTLALGSGSFSVLSVAIAYAVLANEGKEVIPKTIRYVTDQNGEMLRNYEREYIQMKERSLIDRSTAFIIRHIIRDVFRPGGTAYKPDLLKEFKHKESSFGKTGTTSNWKDAWFAGANDHLSTAVWLGYDDNRSLGRHQTGGRMAAPVWIEFQKSVLGQEKMIKTTPPKDVIKKRICLSCEGIAGPSCPQKQIRDEYFKIDNYPQEICYDARSEKEDQFKKFIKKFKRNEKSKF